MINLKNQHYTKKYSARYFRNRLLQLQKLSQTKNIDCILLILGIDSNWDREMQKCTNWLLEGQSGLDVNGTPLTSAFSNSIFAITSDSLYIFTDSKGYKHISILAANIANCNLFSLSEIQEYSEDISEATKIAKFYQIMKDKKTVGIPCEGVHDIKSIQQWPLIQAYGLDCKICEAFSMRYQFGQLSLANQEQNFMKIQENKENFSKVKDRQEDKLPIPRALIGERSSLGYQARSSSSTKIKDHQSKSHFTLEYVQRNSSLRVARTYFLNSLQKNNSDVLYLSKIYQIVAKIFKQTAVDIITGKIDIKEYIINTIQDQILGKCLLDAKFDFKHNLYDNFGGLVEEKKSQNKSEDFLHILRLQISNIKNSQNIAIPGSLLFCDTFIVIDPGTVFNLTETVPIILFFELNKTDDSAQEKLLGKKFQTYQKVQGFFPQKAQLDSQEQYKNLQEKQNAGSEIFNQFSQMMIGSLTVFENGLIYTDPRLGRSIISFDMIKQCRIYTDSAKENWLEFHLESNQFLPLKGFTKNAILIHPTAEFLSERFSWMIQTFQDESSEDTNQQRKIKVHRIDSFPYQNILQLCNFRHAKSLSIHHFYDAIFNQILQQQYARFKSKRVRNVLIMMEYLMHAEMTIKHKDKSFLAYSAFEQIFQQASLTPNPTLSSLSAHKSQSESPESTSDSSSTSSSLKKIYFVSGIPGSGKTQLAQSLVRFMNEKQQANNQNWVCVTTPVHLRTKFSPKQLISSLEKAIQQTSGQQAQNYVIPITGYHHLKKVVYHFRAQNQFNANYKIEAVITKIHAKNFYMSKNKMTYQYLLQNCTAGLCNVIVIQRAYMLENEFNEIVRVIQSVNSVPIIKIKNKILNKLAFDQVRESLKAVQRLERVNKFHMKFNYSFEKEGKSKFYSDRFPISSEIVSFKAPLNPKILKSNVVGCFGRGGLEKIKNVQTDVTNFANTGVSEIDQEKYLKEMIDSINSKFDPQSMFIQRFYGICHLENEEGKSVMISANGIEFSSKAEKSKIPIEEYQLLVHGRNLQNVKEFLNKFRTPPKERLPLKTRQNMSEKEIEQIQSKNANFYIPDGIVYDGKLYYDFEGNIYERHPNLEDLIKMHIDEENSKIGDYNRSLTKQETANKKLYS